MRATFAVAVPLLAAALVAVASDQCPRLPSFPQYGGDLSPQGCVCGAALGNLRVSLSKSFKVGAACRLHWPRPTVDEPIDLKVTRTSLDDYAADGNLPLGDILLSGNSTLAGVLVYNPGDAGKLWFTPRHNIAVPGTAFSMQVRSLKLSRQYSPDEFQVPPALRKSCWSATATISIENVWVTIGGGDSAGAYPVRYKVISVVDHKAQRCD
jgi:hypothetical protein